VQTEGADDEVEFGERVGGFGGGVGFGEGEFTEGDLKEGEREGCGGVGWESVGEEGEGGLYR